jgi:hypothetical protein
VIVIGFAMLVIVGVAALVVAYVAYPQRGREVPKAPWLGDAMIRAATRMGVHEEPVPQEHGKHR